MFRNREIKVRVVLLRGPAPLECLDRLAQDTLRHYDTFSPMSTTFRWTVKLLFIACGKLRRPFGGWEQAGSLYVQRILRRHWRTRIRSLWIRTRNDSHPSRDLRFWCETRLHNTGTRGRLKQFRGGSGDRGGMSVLCCGATSGRLQDIALRASRGRGVVRYGRWSCRDGSPHAPFPHQRQLLATSHGLMMFRFAQRLSRLNRV